MVTIDKVKEYWERHIPQYWYSNKDIDTKEYYDELQQKRYSYYYPYLYVLAEFDKHKDERVLEIGCGQGTDLLQFAKGGAIVTGLDLTEDAIKKTEDIFKAYKYKVNLKVKNAEDLNCFEDNYFDIVYSFGVLHHTPKTQEAIDNIYRILKHGGKVIIMLYAQGLNYFYKFFYYHVFKGEFLKYSLVETISLHSEHRKNCPLTKMYSKREAKSFFHKFRIVSIKKLYNPQVKDYFPKFIYNPFQKLFGDNLFIKAVK